MTLEQLCILANAGFTKNDINAIISQTTPPQTAPPQTAPPQTAPPQTAPPQTAPPQTAPPQTAPPQTVPPQTVQPQTVPSQALDVLQYLNRSLDRFEVPPERTASQVLEERYVEQTSGQSYTDWLNSMKGDVK